MTTDTSKTAYRRLPGTGKGLLGIYRLFEGPDHILSVHTVSFVENYKRFFYKDIQAIAIYPSPWGKVQNIVLGLLIALHAWPVMVTSGGLRAFNLVMMAIWGLMLAVNTWWGPTCRT